MSMSKFVIKLAMVFVVVSLILGPMMGIFIVSLGACMLLKDLEKDKNG